jgi:UPF0148 protein
MSQVQNTKSKMTLTAELIRRGATILQEPCPRCGAVQIRYGGKVYCTSEDDLESLLSEGSGQSPREHPPAQAKVGGAVTGGQNSSDNMESLKKLLDDKLKNLSKQLDGTTDIDEQTRILNLISKYLETLEKVKTNSA